MKKVIFFAFLLCSVLLCHAQKSQVMVGAEQTSEYFPILKGKRIAIFSNHTGMVGDKHLLDVLIENKFNVVAIFSPEHGFRGDADAGEHVKSSVDSKTGVPILSLYDGKDRKPSDESMRAVAAWSSQLTAPSRASSSTRRGSAVRPSTTGTPPGT